MAAVVKSAVQFAPYSSAVDAAFWHRLTENKLEIYQLDDKPKPLQGYYVNSKCFKNCTLFIGKSKSPNDLIALTLKTHLHNVLCKSVLKVFLNLS